MKTCNMWLEGDMSTHTQGGALRCGGFLRLCKTDNIVTSELQCHKFLAWHASKRGVVQESTPNEFVTTWANVPPHIVNDSEMLRDWSLQQQEMDYCMVALPYASAFHPMLHLFTRVISRSNPDLQWRDDDPFSSNKTSIYLLHRNGLSPVNISTQHLIALSCHRLWIDSCSTISCLNPWRYIRDFSERIWKCKLTANVNYYCLCNPAVN